MSPPRFPFVEVDLAPERADEVSYLLMALGAAGVDHRDDTTMQKGPGGGRVRLVATFDARSTAEEAAETLRQEGLQPRVDELVGDAWREAYKEHFRPFPLTDTIVVAPPWERGEGKVVLELDPGRAFGTGLHATTSLVAQQMERDVARLRGARLLDVGTGSGILALCGLVLGATHAVAVDNDPDVVEVVRENAAGNGLGARIEVSTTPVEQVEGSFPYVVANIRGPVLIEMAEALRARTAGRLVVSGVLRSEVDAVRAALVAHGLSAVGVTQREDPAFDDVWCALSFDG